MARPPWRWKLRPGPTAREWRARPAARLRRSTPGACGNESTGGIDWQAVPGRPALSARGALGRERPENPEPAHAAIRVDVEPHVGARTAIGQLGLEVMLRSASSLVSASTGVHDSSPAVSASSAAIGRAARVDRAAVGIVALEVVGVDLDAPDRGRAGRARTTAQSCPGPRRRRVSQPSPMLVERPGMIRLSRDPKNMSLAAVTTAAVLDGRQIDRRPRRRRGSSPAPRGRRRGSARRRRRERC